ncbi:MAG: 5'-nucleotidase [Pseudomonadota bacterium]|nr:5'-nucleotidase [Pseudomonadota bacterium]
MSIESKLIVAISSRALFDMREAFEVFNLEGDSSYKNHQITNEDIPYEKGPSFNFVAKLLSLNACNDMIEVVLLSRNSSDTGLRVLNSIQHYKLDINRAVFTRGRDPYAYLESFNADLFLSANSNDVESALAAGFAAATIWPDSSNNQNDKQLRLAFDGDAVLFSDESEQIYQKYGLKKFLVNEKVNADKPLAPGPFKSFFLKLANIQSNLNKFSIDYNPIRTLLITARSMPAHTRVIKTIRSWGVSVDEAIFLAGTNKGDFLRAFGADIYFDDQVHQCQTAVDKTTIGHVPSGVMNTTD